MTMVLFTAGLLTAALCGFDALASEYTFKTRALGYGMALCGWALAVFALLLDRGVVFA